MIRDSLGLILGSFLGAIDCLDSNGVEVCAMLMGCCQLCDLVGLNAIIEGGSFLAIQWGLGKSKCPWRITDWVEEIQHISAQLRSK